jgi:hypothetical protein
MSKLFEKSGKGAKGAMSLFPSFAKSEKLSSGSSESGPWSATWEARGPGFPFMVPKGESSDIVILEDFRPLVVHKLCVGWSTGKRGSWPRSDWARSASFTGDIDDDGNPIQSDADDLFATALGRRPSYIFVTRILNLTPYTVKRTNETIPWRVQLLVVDSDRITEQIQAASDAAGRDMRLAKFRVNRSNGLQSMRLGDSWTLLGFADDDMIETAKADDELPEFDDKLAAIDIAEGYPTYTDSEAISLLKLHKRYVDEHSKDNNAAWFSYQDEGMREVIGEEKLGSNGGSGILIKDAEPKEPAAKKTSILGSLTASGGLDAVKDVPEGEEPLENPFKPEE